MEAQGQNNNQNGGPEKGFYAGLHRLGITRSQERWVGGVCGGLADHLKLDVTLVRVCIAVLMFFSGIGLVLYAVAWVLLPDRKTHEILLQQASRGVYGGALLIAVAMFIVGGFWSDGWFGRWNDWVSGPLKLLLTLGAIGIIVYLVVEHNRQRPGPPQKPFVDATEASPFPSPTSTESVTHNYVPAQPVNTVPLDQQTKTKNLERATSKRLGRTLTTATLGLVILFVAAVLLLHETDWLYGNYAAVIIAGTLVICGGMSVLCAFLGRSSGGISTISWIALITCIPALYWTNTGFDLRHASWNLMGESTQTVQTVSEAESGFALGIGNLTVDLRELDLEKYDSEVRVPIRLGVGEVTVIVPKDTTVEVQGDLGAGEVFWQVDDQDREKSGFLIRNFSFSANASENDPTLVLDVRNIVGNITIKDQE